MPKKRIVILDQDRESALAFAAVLKGAEVSLQLSDDEADFLAEIEAERPDLIVLRAEMDKASGYSICNRVRSGQRAAGCRIVIVSTTPPEERLLSHRISNAAADAYIAPPLGLKDLRLQAYGLLDLDGGVVSEDDIQAIEEDPFARLDQIFSGNPGGISSGGGGSASREPDVAIEERRKGPDFSEGDFDGAFGVMTGQAPAQPMVDEVEEVLESEVLEADMIEVPDVAPSVPSPLQKMSDADLHFVTESFSRAKENLAKAPPLPPGIKREEVRGPEAKILLLREKLREREIELQRVQDIWRQQEEAYRTSGQRVMEMEVEVRAARMEENYAKDKLKTSEAAFAARQRESAASIDRFIEEKVMLEKDLIEVVAGKEKNVNELRRMLASRERDIIELNKRIDAERERELNERDTERGQFNALLETAQQTLEHTRNDFTQALRDAEAQSQREKEQLREEASSRFSELTQMASEREREWASRVEAEQIVVASHEMTIGELRQTLTILDGDLLNARSEITGLTQTLRARDEQIAQLQSSQTALEREREALQDAQRLLDFQLGEVRTDLAQKEEAEKQLREQVGQLQERLEATATQFGQKAQSLREEMQEIKTEKDDQHKRLVDKLTLKDDTITQKDSTLDQLSRELQVSREDREAVVQRLSERLKERETTITELSKEIDTMKAERDNERQRLQAETETMSLKLVELQQQASEKITAQLLEMEGLRQTLQRANIELSAPAAVESPALATEPAFAEQHEPKG